MSKDIYVVVEQRNGNIQKVTYELISEATKLAADLGEQVVAVLMGYKIADKAQSLIHYGAQKVLVLDAPVLEHYTTEPYVRGIEYVIKNYEPNIVLFGASSIGRDMAPRIAGRVHTGLTADCTRLDVEVSKYQEYLRKATNLPEEKIMALDTSDRNLKMTRPAFGGNVMATIVCRNYRPQMATVRPGVMELGEKDTSRTGEVVMVDAGLTEADMNVEILDVVKQTKKAVDITDAKILVSGGRGVGGPEGYNPLRELAAELGVDVSKLDVQGRVMKADVLAAAGVGAAAAPAAEAAAAVESNDEKPVKVNPLRRSIAANMTNSWHTSPRVTYTRPVEVTAMKDLRAKLKDGLKEQGIKLTYNHILMKVVAKALTEFPDVNASFADNMLTRHKHVNMGLAVAKGDGLIVPNVKNCEEKSLAQIAQETEALIEATRTGKLGMEDMTGGTFTISSLGPYGITSFSPIINQPELAILGVCDMVDTPVVRNGEIVIRTMMNLSLTADHRVIDGVMASKFLKRIAELLENPYMLLV